MNKWTLAFIVCLEILANATRVREPKIITKKVPFLEFPIEDNSLLNVVTA